MTLSSAHWAASVRPPKSRVVRNAPWCSATPLQRLDGGGCATKHGYVPGSDPYCTCLFLAAGPLSQLSVSVARGMADLCWDRFEEKTARYE